MCTRGRLMLLITSQSLIKEKITFSPILNLCTSIACATPSIVIKSYGQT